MSLEIGTVLNEKYRIVQTLSEKANVNVYLVDRVKDNKIFVIKELILSSNTCPDPDGIRKVFIRESEFMKKFEHPGIAEVYRTFFENGKDYLVVEYIEGTSLQEITRSDDKPFSIYKAVKWMFEVAETLEELHGQFNTPFVCRDLKPSNIIITPDDEAILVDFGSVPYYKPKKKSAVFSYGSRGYGTPEQAKGRGKSTPQSDIFTLGVILFEMVTKYDPALSPFHFPNMVEINPEISENIESTISCAIQLKPENRYVKIKEFKENLGSYVSSRKAMYKPPPKPVKKEEEESGDSNKILLVLACILGGFIFLILLPVVACFNVLPSVLFIPSGILLAIILILSFAIFKLESYRIIWIFATWFTSFLIYLIIISNFIASGAAPGLSECQRNLADLGRALEKYAEDHDSSYPASINRLIEKTGTGCYLDELPVCPACKKPYLYSQGESSYDYILCCGKERSHIMSGLVSKEGNWPQYTPRDGVKLKVESK